MAAVVPLASPVAVILSVGEMGSRCQVNPVPPAELVAVYRRLLLPLQILTVFGLVNAGPGFTVIVNVVLFSISTAIYFFIQPAWGVMNVLLIAFGVSNALLFACSSFSGVKP